MFLDVLIEIPVLAEFCDDIAIIDTGVNIETSDNIFMVHQLQNTNLAL